MYIFENETCKCRWRRRRRVVAMGSSNAPSLVTLCVPVTLSLLFDGVRLARLQNRGFPGNNSSWQATVFLSFLLISFSYALSRLFWLFGYSATRLFFSFPAMFSFRRRPRSSSTADSTLRQSPSLPQLHAQSIPWPENLVDATVLQKTPTSSDEDSQVTPRAATPVVQPRQQGAVKTSFYSLDRAPIPFHKPFRSQVGDVARNGPISSMYKSHHPPSSFDNWRSSTPTSVTSAPNRRTHNRKSKASPAFNVMVRPVRRALSSLRCLV